VRPEAIAEDRSINHGGDHERNGIVASAPPAEGAQGFPQMGAVRPLRPYVMADDPEPLPAAVPEPAQPAPPAGPGPEPLPAPAPVPVPAPAPDPDPVVPGGPAAGADDDPPAGRSSLALRPFLLTAGRVAGSGTGSETPPLPLETQVVATAEGLAALDGLTFEHQAIVAACRVPQSLAELAARLRLHLNVVRVIAGDLHSARQLAVYVPQASTAQDVSVLRRVIDGLRAVPDSRGLPRGNRPA
jgi:hypothetical protein